MKKSKNPLLSERITLKVSTTSKLKITAMAIPINVYHWISKSYYFIKYIETAIDATEITKQ